MNGNPATFDLRDVGEEDWPAVLALANASVAHVSDAGVQDEWLHNRRTFDLTARRQWHYVCTESGAIVGYGGVETDLRGEFRIFIVVRATDLEQVGELLYQRALALLARMGATRVWFTEHASDAPLRAFAEVRDFREVRSFRAPSGLEAITWCKLFPEAPRLSDRDVLRAAILRQTLVHP